MNSTLYDVYYRILNGSTQVNATEMNTIPVPERAKIERMGRKVLMGKDYSTYCCDRIMEEIIYV